MKTNIIVKNYPYYFLFITNSLVDRLTPFYLDTKGEKWNSYRYLVWKTNKNMLFLSELFKDNELLKDQFLPIEIKQTIKHIPYLLDNQKQISDKMISNRLGLNFSEMRTGKTLQTIEAILSLEIKEGFLLICPKSVLYYWKNELEKFGITNDLYLGPNRQNNVYLNQVLIMTKDIFKIDFKKRPKFFLNYTQIIIDEAHFLRIRKSIQTNTFQTFLPKCKRVWLLTGTPVSKGAYELLNYLKVSVPNSQFALWDILNSYCVLDLWNQVIDLKQVHKRTLIELMDFYGARLNQHDIGIEQDSEDIEIVLPMLPSQQKYYDEVTTTGRIKSKDIQLLSILEMRTFLKQYTGIHPKFANLSAKKEWIIDFIKENREKQIIIGSVFKKDLYILKEEFLKLNFNFEIITGDTKLEDRTKIIENMQSKKTIILLANIHALKEGVTLDAINTLIFINQYEDYNVNLQFRERITDTLKKEVKEKKHIYKLMIKETIDEGINRLLSKRVAKSDIINNINKYILELNIWKEE